MEHVTSKNLRFDFQLENYLKSSQKTPPMNLKGDDLLSALESAFTERQIFGCLSSESYNSSIADIIDDYISDIKKEIIRRICRP